MDSRGVSGRRQKLRRRVSETLGLLSSSESDHVLILDMALAEVGERFDPTNPAQFALFVGGPLHQAISEIFGPRAASELQAILDPILSDREIEESGVHRVGNSERPESPGAVLLATAQRSAREAFGEALEADGYAVQTCVDVTALAARCRRDAADNAVVAPGGAPRTGAPLAIVADLDWLDTDAAGLLVRLRSALRSSSGASQRSSSGDLPPLILLTNDEAAEPVLADAVFLNKPVTTRMVLATLEQLLPERLGPNSREPWTAAAEPLEEPPEEVFEEDTFVSSTMKRLAYETLDMVASPSVRNDMLSEALDRAQLYDLPVETDALSAWLIGPLLEVVAEVLGDDVAETLLAQLQPVLTNASLNSTSLNSDADEAWEDDAEQTPPSRRGRKGLRTSVVVVDDDPSVLSSLERQLGQRGYDVRIEREAQMAITLCTDRLPSVVVAASQLPDASGRELDTLLKLTFGDEAPPLVLLSHRSPLGSQTEPDVARVLHKPVDVNELCELIDTLREAARQTG
jgi:CheY-like chemotaxis protein